MAECLDSITLLAERVRAVNIAREATETVSSLLEDTNFYENMEDIGLSGETFTLDGDIGNITLRNNGEEVDLTGAIKNLSDHGDIIGAMKDLRVPDNVLSEPPIQRYAAKYKVMWENQPGNLEIKYVEKIESMGENLERKLQADPKNFDEFREFLKDKDVNRKFGEFKKQIDDARNEGTPFQSGKWVKRVLLGGGIFVGALAIYNEITKHKDIMNGCWMVDVRSGKKCKIRSLTCTGISSDSAQHMCPIQNVCGDNGVAPCFASNTCIKKRVDGTCERTIGKCTTGTCNVLCSPATTLNVPPGKKLQCVSVNFWGAAEDLMHANLSNIFGSSFTWWLLPIAVISVIILILIR